MSGFESSAVAEIGALEGAATVLEQYVQTNAGRTENGDVLGKVKTLITSCKTATMICSANIGLNDAKGIELCIREIERTIYTLQSLRRLRIFGLFGIVAEAEDHLNTQLAEMRDRLKMNVYRLPNDDDVDV